MTGAITNDPFSRIMSDIKEIIKAEAERLGFCLCGFTTADPSEDFPRYIKWIREDALGTMAYLKREDTLAKRADPRLLLPDAQSICVLAVPMALFPHRSAFSIASYAHYADYHDTILPMAEELVNNFRSYLSDCSKEPEHHTAHLIPDTRHLTPDFSYRICIDSSPILERSLAVRAGLGWVGKSSMLINRKYGSAFFLCEILLSLPIEPDKPYVQDGCGSCTRCIDACPNHCIDPLTRTIRADRCAAYLTIEHKGDFSPEQSALVGTHLFGCDECLLVSPWNRRAPSASLLPLTEALPEESDENLTAEEFKIKFHNSPVLRTKIKGLQRNIAAVRKNLGKGEGNNPERKIV